MPLVGEHKEAAADVEGDKMKDDKVAIIFIVALTVFAIGFLVTNSQNNVQKEMTSTVSYEKNTMDTNTNVEMTKKEEIKATPVVAEIVATPVVTEVIATPEPKEDTTLSLSLSDISEKAEWYEYDTGTNLVRFFAVKTSDGEVKTAFDACDICYRSKQGYSQDGDDMICNQCGNRYPLSGLGTKNKAGGGCWPGYLPHKIVGDEVVIEKAVLEENAWRFP